MEHQSDHCPDQATGIGLISFIFFYRFTMEETKEVVAERQMIRLCLLVGVIGDVEAILTDGIPTVLKILKTMSILFTRKKVPAQPFLP